MKEIAHNIQSTLYIKSLYLLGKLLSLLIYIKPYVINFFMFIFTFMYPATPIVVATILVIGLDTIMGLWKCRVTKEPRNSNAFKRGFVPKALIYTLLIFIGFVTDKLLLNEFVTYLIKKWFDINSNFVATKILALILISNEAKSIDENFTAIFGVSIKEKINQLIKKLKQPLKNLLDNDKK